MAGNSVEARFTIMRFLTKNKVKMPFHSPRSFGYSFGEDGDSLNSPLVLARFVSLCVLPTSTSCLQFQKILILRLKMKALRQLSSFQGIISSSVFHKVSYHSAHINPGENS